MTKPFTIKGILEAVDTYDKPFLSHQLLEDFFPGRPSKSLSAMLNILMKNEILESVAMMGKRHLYWRKHGRSAVEMHSEYLVKAMEKRAHTIATNAPTKVDQEDILKRLQKEYPLYGVWRKPVKNHVRRFPCFADIRKGASPTIENQGM